MPVSHIEASPAPGAARAWLAATRPATLPAAAGPVLVGLALARAHGAWSSSLAAATMATAILLQIGANLTNDYADFLHGADDAERLGPARATQQGWLTPGQVRAAAAACFGLAVLTGLPLLAAGGWPVAALGAGAVAAGVLYTAGPAPLGYLGLGDLLVMAFFGFAAVGGSYYLQTGAVSGEVLWVSVASGSLATAVLVVNNLRDRVSDARTGKGTLVVRLGERFGRWQYTGLLVLAYMVVLGVQAASATPRWGWALPLLTMPLAAREVGRVLARRGRALNASLVSTARLLALFHLLLAAGVLL